MAESFDCLVLGTGGVGSAALYHLARRGARVLGLDRFEPGHDRGSSHGATRLIRLAYYEHPNYVPLLQRAYALWAELEATTGQTLYRETGILEVGIPGGRIVPGVLQSAQQHRLQVDQLTPAEAMHRFPAFRLPDDCRAVFEQKAGFLYVEPCVLVHVALAKQAGAQVRAGVTVHDWQPAGDGVLVRTSAGDFHARRLVVSAGAWARDLLAGLGLRLEVVRKSLYWHSAPATPHHADEGMPGYICETPGGEFYGFPMIDEQGIKAAEHSRGLPVDDPLNVDRAEDPAESVRLKQFLQGYLPGVSGRQTNFATCLYTLSPDRNFIVDRHPDLPAVCFAAGLSGHGFKFTSVLGEVLAELALEGRSQQPIEFLGLRRFAQS